MIWTSPFLLKHSLECKWEYAYFRNEFDKVVLVSGGFDPIHAGHVRHIQSASLLGYLVVLVNGDSFLKRKKGYVFMGAEERAEIVHAIAGVKQVLIYNSESQYIDSALNILKPHILAKGGDRTPDNMVICEIEACKKVGTEIIYGVGGGKIQSSQRLTRGYSENSSQAEWEKRSVLSEQNQAYSGKSMCWPGRCIR